MFAFQGKLFGTTCACGVFLLLLFFPLLFQAGTPFWEPPSAASPEAERRLEDRMPAAAALNAVRQLVSLTFAEAAAVAAGTSSVLGTYCWAAD